jgi:hypothetical protein
MNFQRQMNELKAIARDLGVEPVGDRRKRETWEQAIAQHQLFSVPQSSDTSDISPGVETEPVILFDCFAATYTPPQAQIHYQIEADGQLSLLDFQVESVVEFPDPDDVESLDAFHEAIVLWDLQHPIDASLDSFTYWAPCSDDWYEPAGENIPGVDRVQEPTEDFTSSEPEPINLCPCSAMPASQCDGTTAYHIFNDRIVAVPCYKHQHSKFMPARSPSGGEPSDLKRIPNAYQTHSCFVGGTVGHLGRSPPGGDAMV